jgi:UPF0176 protein
MEKEHQVLLFYKYVTVEDPTRVANWLRGLAVRYQLLGRGIVAKEGINATFEGLLKNTEKFAAEVLANPLLADMQIKRSAGDGKGFGKLSVKVREEIVGTQFPLNEADPRVKTAPRISPAELKEWYKNNKDFVVVDMRNDYEFASGHFKNAVEPGISASRDLPQALPKLEPLKDKTVLTVCTGGVRCEKMSAYLQSHGFKDVYQLDGGIHSYMEKYPGEDFLGTLYTFDRRLTMDFGGPREIIGTCDFCEAKTERYVNCAYDKCHRHFLVCTTCIPLQDIPYCNEECRLALQA